MTENNRPRRSWKNLILDARYQISFALPMVLLAAGLGISPLFLQPALEANPWFWGAVVWYGCMRAMCRVEATDSLQMEMGLGLGLALLVLVEPAARRVFRRISGAAESGQGPHRRARPAVTR